MSLRSKKLVAMALHKTESDRSSNEQKLLPLYTEDDIQIGVLEPLSRCPIQDSSSRKCHGEIKPKQKNTDGCFLKVSSHCDGFSIQPSIENERVEVVFYTNNDAYPTDIVTDTDVINDCGDSNKNDSLADTADVSAGTIINNYNFELSTTEDPIANDNSKFHLK